MAISFAKSRSSSWDHSVHRISDCMTIWRGTDKQPTDKIKETDRQAEGQMEALRSRREGGRVEVEEKK